MRRAKLALVKVYPTLANIGGRTWFGMKAHPCSRIAWVRRPGVLVRHDHASLACTRGLIARAKAYVRSVLNLCIGLIETNQIATHIWASFLPSTRLLRLNLLYPGSEKCFHRGSKVKCYHLRRDSSDTCRRCSSRSIFLCIRALLRRDIWHSSGKHESRGYARSWFGFFDYSALMTSSSCSLNRFI